MATLVDTGPLVAIASARDQHHQLCVEQLRQLQPPLLTCWPVITEAAWLLRHHSSAVERLLGSFEVGLLRLLALDEKALRWLAVFLMRYRKMGAQIADGALIYLAERERIDMVFTLDRRGFLVSRLGNGRSLRILP
ncbi:MAG: type II toxin-antitoxin system VapC family toxin [Terriglobia bacterium]